MQRGLGQYPLQAKTFVILDNAMVQISTVSADGGRQRIHLKAIIRLIRLKHVAGQIAQILKIKFCRAIDQTRVVRRYLKISLPLSGA